MLERPTWQVNSPSCPDRNFHVACASKLSIRVGCTEETSEISLPKLRPDSCHGTRLQLVGMSALSLESVTTIGSESESDDSADGTNSESDCSDSGSCCDGADDRRPAPDRVMHLGESLYCQVWTTAARCEAAQTLCLL